MFPISKYKFYTDNARKVVAVSTYAGKTVRGVAVCGENDVFDINRGMDIASSRCNVKVAEKRLQRAEERLREAEKRFVEAGKYLESMREYFNDAIHAYEAADTLLDDVLFDNGFFDEQKG